MVSDNLICYIMEQEPDDCYNAAEENASTSASAENFQKCMLNIFEKNGILNDLRAYLRGHIVEVLRNAQNGKPITAQKYFKQRLELDQQALNILLVEYLLNMQFNYTISVFISEIPLANMVFDYAKKMLCGVDGNECSQLRFAENDVWSVLNFLGVQCDSVYASNVLKMYSTDDKTPLLICLLKCMPIYQKCQVGEESSTSQSQLSDRTQDSKVDYYPETSRKQSHHLGNCKHMNSCKTCRKKILSLKDKSKKIKEYYIKQVNEQNRPDVANLMQHVGDVENTILGEMFEEMKNVYESEIDLVRAREEKRVQRTLASHALLMNRQREEMEDTLKEKCLELDQKVSHKKAFLHEVAANLRGQRSTLAAALKDVRLQHQTIMEKEDKLKEDLLEAEKTLRKRGEEMRQQTSKELSLLDTHLESMRREREIINEEKQCLELLKSSIVAKTNESRNEILITQGVSYDKIPQNESVLKKMNDALAFESKSIIEKGTVTEAAPISKSNLLNNGSVERGVGRDVAGRPSVQKVVNDLKRQKNVNFSQTTVQVDVGESPQASREKSQYMEALQRLRQENEQLRTYAAQQRSHIASLPAWRPLTAPEHGNVISAGYTLRLNRSSNNVSSTGAGEAGAGFSAPQRPAERIPFISGLDRRPDHKRQLINQWRKLRKRLSPTYTVRKPTTGYRLRGTRPASAATTSKVVSGNSGCVEFNERFNGSDRLHIGSPPRDRSPLTRSDRIHIHSDRSPLRRTDQDTRDRSPKSVLREAKQRLRNKDINRPRPPEKREKSPNSVLQEAKQKLRKLEIEAEAVERSYRDFRKKQSERVKADVLDTGGTSLGLTSSKPNIHRTTSNTNTSTSQPVNETYQFLKADYEKYINIVETYFQNKNTALNVAKPLPEAVMQENNEAFINKVSNYIDTPLRDFRKLYDNIEKQNIAHSPTDGLLYDNKEDIKREPSPKRINFENTRENIYNTGNSYKPDPQSIDEAEKLVAAKAKLKNSSVERNIIPIDKPSQLNILQEDDENENEDIKENETKQNIDGAPFNKKKELEILNENLNQLYNLSTKQDDVKTEKPTVEEAKDNTETDSKKNMLRIELVKGDKGSTQVLKTNKSGKFILTLESSVENELSVSQADVTDAPAPMSILISPKKVSVLDKVERSKTCPNLSEKEPKRRQLKRNDRKASGEGNTCLAATSARDKSKDYSTDDYTDDFSQDVDNYTSRRDGSPVSFAKSLEDDNFWET